MAQPVALDTKKTNKAEKIEKKTETKEIKEENQEDKEATDSTGESETSESEPKEEGQQAAYNPETGEINWDCPCLGGMANGPCGEEFKEAFSCFIFSESEPKGFDCIEKFKNMQNCFRRYPDVYSEEIRGEDEPADDFNQPEDHSPAAASASVEAPGAPVHQVARADVIADVEVNTPVEAQPVEEVFIEEVFVKTVPTTEETAAATESK